jgi:hypothetical protein
MPAISSSREALADEMAGGHPAFYQIAGAAVFDRRLPS